MDIPRTQQPIAPRNPPRPAEGQAWRRFDDRTGRGRPMSQAVQRIDMPVGHAGFPAPPCPVQLKFLPSPHAGDWVLLANVRPDGTGAVAAWLAEQGTFEEVSIAPGIAPRLVRARARTLPPLWSEMAALVAVRHLDL